MGNESSHTRTINYTRATTAIITPLDNLSLTLTGRWSQLRADEDDPIYAMIIRSWRCEVKKLSTVHFVAVRSRDRDKSTFPPHCGLMLKNKFYLENGEENKRHEFDYLLAHAFIKDVPREQDDRMCTKLVLFFCNSREEVYQQLQGVHKNYSEADRAMSPGVESYTSCATLVGLIKKELRKPFDVNWAQHLKGNTGKCSDDVTNCALFAARIFKHLTPSSEQNDCFEYIQRAFREINLDHMMSVYRGSF